MTAGELRRHGWTGALIRRFAGPADHLAVNPHHPGGPAMRLYERARIEAVEADALFIEARHAAERRQDAAKKGQATKADNAAASAAGDIAAPGPPPAARGELIRAAAARVHPAPSW